MGSVIFGCIDIGNKDDIPKTFFDSLQNSDAVVVENKYMWDEFCLNNQIEYNKEILSINLPGLKGKFLNELTEEMQGLFYDNRDLVLKRIKELYEMNKNILVVSDEGSPILADSGEIVRTYCLNNDIDFRVLAGPSAIINTLSMSRIPGPTSPFVFYGPIFSMQFVDEFLDKIENVPYNFLGVAFLAPKTAKDVVLSMLNKFGNLDSSLCVNLTMETEKVIGKTLQDVYEYLLEMGDDYYLLKERASLVFRKTDNR